MLKKEVNVGNALKKGDLIRMDDMSRFRIKTKIGKEDLVVLEKDIFQICKYGLCERLYDFIANCIDFHKSINVIDKDDFSPLHYAVRYKHSLVIKILLENGADPNICGASGVTPLHMASRYTTNRQVMVTHSSDNELTRLGTKKCQFSMKNEKDQVLTTFFNDHYSSYHGTRSVSPINIDSVADSVVDTCTSVVPPIITSKQRSCITVPRADCEIPADSEIIEMLLFRKVNINAVDQNNSTPLHYAAIRGNSFAVQSLLLHPYTNIECKDSNWMTPLHHAAARGKVQIASLLVNRGASFSCVDKLSMTPLHIACEEGNLKFVEFIISHTQKKGIPFSKFCNAYNRDYETPLHFAASTGREDIVKVLIENGADCRYYHHPNFTTPMHLACAAGSLETIILLLDSDPMLLNATNNLKEVPLHHAVSFNNEKVVQYLLERNCEVNCCDVNRESSLMKAVKKDFDNIAKLLIENNAKVFLKDIYDHTCLHYCAIFGSAKCASYFMELECRVELLRMVDIHENTALHVAAEYGFLNVCRILQEADVGITLSNLKNDLGLTPAILASKYGHMEVAEYFIGLDYGLLLDEDDSDNTALHLAAMNGHLDVVRLLLSKGAVVDNINSELHTPLHMAVIGGHIKVCKILVHNNASLDMPDKSRLTPLMLACKLGHTNIVSLLVDVGCSVLKLDHYFRNCLDIAIDGDQREVAAYLVQCEYWAQLLKNCSLNAKDVVTTPMRKLIKKMPDVAKIVFDKCIVCNDLPENHPKFQLTMDYQFLDDLATEWGYPLRETAQGFRDNGLSFEWLSPKTQITQKEQNVSFKERFIKGFGMQRNRIYAEHPLSLMVKKERVTLLNHVLVSYFLRYKWARYGKYAYYFRFVFFILFLILLTGFSYSVRTLPIPLNESGFCIPGSDNNKNVGSFIFSVIAPVFIVIVCILDICLRILDFLWDIKSLTFYHAFEVASCLITMLFAISGMSSVTSVTNRVISFRCSNIFRSIGSIAVLMSYISFVLFMRKFPKIGIYVVMYTDVMKTFIRFSPLYFILIFSFGISFYLVFQDREEPNAYVTLFRSFMKIFLGTIGEIELDTFFNDVANPPLTVAWALLVLFVICNTLILMNLLVGLAVDDIQGVQSKAVLKRLALQVDLAMGIESVLPLRYKNKRTLLVEHIYPNSLRKWSIWSFWEYKTQRELSSGHRKLEKEIDALKHSQSEIKSNFKNIRNKLQEFERNFEKIERVLQEIAANFKPSNQTFEEV